MSDNQKTSGSSQQEQQEQGQSSSGSGSVYRDSRDPLGANLSWSSIKSAWQELKNS